MKRHGVVLVALGAVLWGTDSLFRRPLTQELSPITIVCLEHCVLTLVMLPRLARSRNQLARLKLRDWTALIFIALGGSVAATSLFTFAIKYGNPSITVLLQKTQPVLTALLARWFLRERPSQWFWYWLGPALVGAYLVAAPDWRTGFSFSSHEPVTILAGLGAAWLWGASTVFGRYIVRRLPILVLTGLRFAIALPLLAILYGFQPVGERQLPSTFTSGLTVIGMALIPGLVALIFYYKGLQFTIASLAAVGELAFPITAVVTNWILLHVRLTGSQFLGGTILVAAVTALTFLDAREKSRQANHES